MCFLSSEGFFSLAVFVVVVVVVLHTASEPKLDGEKVEEPRSLKPVYTSALNWFQSGFNLV